jgi:hypothetical protein
MELQQEKATLYQENERFCELNKKVILLKAGKHWKMIVLPETGKTRQLD